MPTIIVGRMTSEFPSRRETSDAVSDIGWRFVLGTLRAQVPVASLTQATEVASHLTGTAGVEPDDGLRLDLRPDRVLLTIYSPRAVRVAGRDIELARRVSTALTGLGLRAEPGSAPTVQAIEIAIDALDIPAVRPFWKAVMAYVGEAGKDGPEDALVDPLGQAPAIWFQQMDAPRPQRNRIHFDVSVPHDEAPGRIAAALAAGGTLVSDTDAPRFWVLADAEGNEACVTTWQGRD
jgi:4a-hydroxytetrahydrobiopterin dehydratase